MNFTYLRYFVTIIDAGSITDAAERLYVSRQALSKAVRQMEAELQTELLKNRYRGVEPTDAGRILYQSASELLKQWDQTSQAIARTSSAYGLLNAGFGEVSHYIWPADQLAQFHQLNPSIQVKAKNLLPDLLVEELLADRLDLVVSNLYCSDPSVQVDTIVKRPIYAMVSKNDELAGRAAVYPEDLAGRVNVFIVHDTCGWQYFQSMMSTLGLKAEKQFCPDSSILTIYTAIRHYHGVFLTSAIFKNALYSPDCVLIPFATRQPEELYNHNIHFIYRRSSLKMASISCYRTYLLQHVKEEFR